MKLEPVAQDPVEVSERQADAAQGPAMVTAGAVVMLGAPFLLLLGAGGLFGVLEPVSHGIVPFILLAAGVADLSIGGAMIYMGKKRSAQAK